MLAKPTVKQASLNVLLCACDIDFETDLSGKHCSMQVKPTLKGAWPKALCKLQVHETDFKCGPSLGCSMCSAKPTCNRTEFYSLLHGVVNS